MTVRRVLLPGINIKELVPVASLMSPTDLVIPMLFVTILAQLVDHFKYILSPKDILKIDSVKLYSNLIMFSLGSVSLSVIFSISRTLSYEFEVLQHLSTIERNYLFSNLKKSLMLDQSFSLDKKNLELVDISSDLSDYRRKSCLQFRSVLLSTALFSSNSILFGLPLSLVDLNVILDSSKLIWISLGLSEEDFTFKLIKDSLNKISCLDSSNYVSSTITEIDSIRILSMFEFKKFFHFSTYFSFEKDFVPLNCSDNIVNLEKHLGFIRRNSLDKDSSLLF